MRSVLVTGGLGFIGGHVAANFLASGDLVTVVDNLDEVVRDTSDRRETMDQLAHPNLRVELTRISQYVAKPGLRGVDVVVHAAGSVGLAPSWRLPDHYLANNLGETKMLAQAVRASTVDTRVVHLSTSSVYGRMAVGAEDLPVDPCSPYGTSKLRAEQVWTGDEELAARTTVLRLFSVYGPRQRPDMAWSRFIESAKAGEPVCITGDGDQSRSFTYVDDVVDAIDRASRPDAPNGVFNICGGHVASVNEGLDILEQLLNRPIERKYTARLQGDQEHTAGDGRRASSLLGFRPTVTLEFGLAAQLAAGVVAAPR